MAKIPEQVNLHIVFCGDIMTHGNQIRAAKRKDGTHDFSHYFDNTRSYIQAADLAVCNCETTMAGGDAYTGYPRFNTPDALADAIKGAGFSVVATANNHSYDSKCTGIIRTRSVLESRGLQVIGTKKTAHEKAWAIVERKGIKIAVLNYTYETAKHNGAKTLNNRALDPEAESLLNSFCYETLEEDLARVEHDIQEVRQNGAEVILVYYHWGNEYERTSNVLQKYIAYRTARMGADAIIGSHAHVLQEQGEVVADGKKVPVFYGLGNYIWGHSPMKGRDTVLNTILANLNITFDVDSRVVINVEPSYNPLYIDIHDNTYGVLDLTEKAEETGLSVSNINAEKIREEIHQSITNQVHPAEVEMFFDKIFEVETGTLKSICDFLPQAETFVTFKSEDAIIASALNNGFVVGNRPGYTGLTAIDAAGRETIFMVRVFGDQVSDLPVLVNENNRVRDIYVPSDYVTGEKYALPAGIGCCEKTALAWKNMLLAARESGIYLNLVSGHRSKKTQLLRQNSYAERYGKEAAQRRYQNFGCSEHHLGTALDINGGSYNGNKSSKTQAITWVQKNCYKFGFVRRKLKSTMANTAYIHVSYVGDLELARYMAEKGLTIEQLLLDYDYHRSELDAQNAWKHNYINESSNKRILSLARICNIIGIEVPVEFQDIQDRIVPQILLSDTVKVEKGSIFFYDKMLAKEMYRCRNALRTGSVLAFASEQILDESGMPMPTIVVEDPLEACVRVGKYIRDLYKAKSICITGSAGKTTTTELCYLVLSSKFNTHTCTHLNNANNRVNILRLIQQLQPEHEMYVQEVGGSFPQHIEKGAEMLQPDVAIITNIGEAQLDLYKTFENIKKDKLSLVENRRPGGLGLLNIDNEWLSEYVSEPREGIKTYSIENPDADYFAKDIQQNVDGLSLTVVEKSTGRFTPVKLDIVGRHNAYNILSAFAVGRWAGMTESEILEGFASYHAKGIRQSLSNVGGYHLYVDCFSSVELSLISSMRTLHEMKCAEGSKKIAAVWELMRLGDQADQIYQRVAGQIRDLDIDHVLIFGGNAHTLAQEMDKGKVDVRHTSDWAQMIDWLRSLSRPGDVILFKGQHMQSTALAIDCVFGTEFNVNNKNERRDNAVAFSQNCWSGMIIHKVAAVIDKQVNCPHDVVIPDQINGKPVICVNKRVFAESGVTSVNTGGQVVGILDEAFQDCKKLETVTLGKQVRRIGPRAFMGCTALKTVIIPRSCIVIDEKAFAGCTNLENILIPHQVQTIASNAFEDCPKLVIQRE